MVLSLEIIAFVLFNNLISLNWNAINIGKIIIWLSSECKFFNNLCTEVIAPISFYCSKINHLQFSSTFFLAADSDWLEAAWCGSIARRLDRPAHTENGRGQRRQGTDPWHCYLGHQWLVHRLDDHAWTTGPRVVGRPWNFGLVLAVNEHYGGFQFGDACPLPTQPGRWQCGVQIAPSCRQWGTSCFVTGEFCWLRCGMWNAPHIHTLAMVIVSRITVRFGL